MKKLIFHFRTTWRKIYIPASMVVFFIVLYNLIFDRSSFENSFDYRLGWFCFFVLIILPNIALVIESVNDWKKK